MKKIITITLIALMFGLSIQAQTKFKDRLYTGGSLGFSSDFSDYTSIHVNPIIGIKAMPKLYMGLGFEYIYTMNNVYDKHYSTNDFGGNVYLQYYVLQNLFAQVQYSAFSYDISYVSNKDRVFVPYLLVGGGIRKQLNSGTFFTASALWDVLQDENSPYEAGVPQINVGVGISL